MVGKLPHRKSTQHFKPARDKKPESILAFVVQNNTEDQGARVPGSRDRDAALGCQLKSGHA